MPLPFSCFNPCSSSSSSSVEVTTRPTTSSDSTTSISSSLPSSTSATSTSFDDALSLQTYPSLPSLQLQSFLPFSSSSSPPLSASILLLSSLPTTTNKKLNNKHLSCTPALAFSPSSPHHLYSSSASQTTLYSSTTPTASFPSPSSAGAVKSISCDKTRIFTAHQDGRIRVYDRPTHRLLATLPTLSDRLRRLPVPSNHVPVRRHRRRLWIQHADAVSALAVRSPLLYSVSWDKTLKVWRLPDLRCLESLPAHDDAVNDVAVVGYGPHKGAHRGRP